MATKTNRDGQTFEEAKAEAAAKREADQAALTKTLADTLAQVDMTGAGCYRKVGEIRAVQLDPNGGDWVAEDARGQRWLITNAVFIENYARQ